MLQSDCELRVYNANADYNTYGGDDEVTEMEGPAVAAEGLSSKKHDGKDKKILKSTTEEEGHKKPMTRKWEKDRDLPPDLRDKQKFRRASYTYQRFFPASRRQWCRMEPCLFV